MTSKKGVKISQLWLQAPVLLHFLAEASSTLMQFPTEKKILKLKKPQVLTKPKIKQRKMQDQGINLNMSIV